MPTRLQDVPADLVVDFDHMDQSLANSFHARLAEMRDRTPVAYSPHHGGFWIVAGYEDVLRVTRDWETFSSLEASIPPNHGSAKVLPVESDPPEHTAYRQVLNPLFSPARMKTLEAEVRERAVALLDTFAGRGSCEFMSEFAHPLPTSTFLALMGWPQTDAPQFVKWNEDILLGVPGGTADENAAVRSAANAAAMDYFAEMIRERRSGKTGNEDVTTQVLNSKFDGERLLTEDELQRLFWVLMLGGLHTVRAVLGFGLIHLAGTPAVRQRIIEEPGDTPGIVEELLRLGAPVSPGRLVTREVEVGAVTMQPGDSVLMLLPSACRDAGEFPAPDELIAGRVPNRHVSFNAGPHRCVGSTLARIELAVALEEIHRRIPDYALSEDQPPALTNGQICGVSELYLTFTPS